MGLTSFNEVAVPRMERMNPVRILIADDYEVVRRGIATVLEARPGWIVVAQAATGREAVEKAKKFKPDIIVLDIGMPELNGLEALRQIQKEVPQSKVLIFTTDESEDIANDALGAGAMGYLFQSDGAEALVTAVESLMQNRPFLTPRVSQMVLENYRKFHSGARVRPAILHLSLREREILQLVAEGKCTKEIAAILNVSGKTVETHRANLSRKLQLRSVSDLVRYAIRNHIIAP